MAERKRTGMRRVPSLENERKLADQMLSTAESSPELENEAKATPVGNADSKKQAPKTRKNNGKVSGAEKASESNNEKSKKTNQNSNSKNTANRGGSKEKAEKKPNSTASKKQSQQKPAQGAQKTQNSSQKGRTSNKNTASKNTVNKSTAQASGAKKTEQLEKYQQIKPNGQNKNNTPKQPSQKPAAQRGRRNTRNKPSIKAYFLGGLNEIGKNFTLFEYGDDMLIVDCGLAFPDEDMYGIDVVIPDFTFVEKNFEKIRGVVITHGHEDHIGGLAYLLKKIRVPVYGTALAMGLIEGKLREHNLLKSAKLNVVNAGSHIKLGAFDVELIHVNHSIADAVALAMKTPAGTIIHTGDFKIDCTPAMGEMIDLARFAELGKEGVLALFAESTNAERPGYTQTEQKVNETLDTLFAKATGKRIIIATFASNTGRVQQIINCAEKYGRKVALSGRSMLNVMGIATNLGYLNVPEGMLIDITAINRYEAGEIVLITTGSQGEPMSALTRMAFADHRQVELSSEDFVILSARPIPGNEKTVGVVVDELLRRGCTVIYESRYDVHVSGHACQEELKIIHALVRPKYFIPVHGEQKHLRKHAELAVSMGMPAENIFIGEVGSAIELSENELKELPKVPAGDILVDGLGVGDVGNVVLNDRKHLAEDGIIITVTAIENSSRRIVSGPDIISRGFVYVRESEKLMDEARKIVYNTIEDCSKGGIKDWTGMKQSIKDSLSGFLYKKTQRSPMILPIIIDV